MSGQRVDAARNRKRVLEAAAHEHARHGSALGMQDVARRAGVGVGTVYRHFPSRQALIEAIATPFFERGLTLARSVRDEAPEGERFALFVRGFARALAASGVYGQCRWDAPAAEPVRTELRELIGEFVEQGRRSGALRGDFTAEDAFALLWTVAALVEAANDTTPEVWQRHIASSSTACATLRLGRSMHRRSRALSGTHSCARRGRPSAAILPIRAAPPTVFRSGAPGAVRPPPGGGRAPCPWPRRARCRPVRGGRSRSRQAVARQRRPTRLHHSAWLRADARAHRPHRRVRSWAAGRRRRELRREERLHQGRMVREPAH